MGGVGSGKTRAGCHEALHLSLKYPKNFGLIGTQTYPQLRDTTRRTFFEICPDELIEDWHKSENLLTFINGSEIIFRSLDQFSKFKSLNLGWFYIDEGTDVPESVFKMLQSRLRLNVPVHRGFITTNPDAFSNWVYVRFVEKPTDQYKVIATTTLDNPYLPDDFIQDLKDSYDDDYYNRYVLGRWGDLEGLVFRNFNRDLHVKEFEADPSWSFYRSIDHGFTNPFCCLFCAVDSDNRIYVMDEIYEKGILVSEHAKRIIQRQTNIFRNTKSDISQQRVITYADPSEAEGNETLRTNGINVMKANNDVILGIQAVQQAMKERADKTYGLIVHPRCTNLVREMGLYKWFVSAGKVNEKEAPLKLNDHAADALRYLIYSISKKRKYSSYAIAR